MQKKTKNFIFLIILIILIIICVIIITRNQNSSLSKIYTDFAVKDTGDITKIFMADMLGKTVTLTRKNSGWLVNDKYEANQDRIELLLETIYKLEVKNPVPFNTRSVVIKSLASSSIKVEIYRSKKKPYKTYYVGGPTPDETGTYMVLDTRNKEPFVVWVPGFNGYLSDGYYYTDEVEWRTKTIYHYSPAEITKVEIDYYREPENSFILQAGENKYFKIEPVLKNLPDQYIDLDTKKVKKFLMGFSNLQFLEVAKDINFILRDSLLNAVPVIKINVWDDKGKNKSLSIYYKKSDQKTKEELMPGIDKEIFYGALNDRKGEIFFLQNLALDKILWKFRDFKK